MIFLPDLGLESTREGEEEELLGRPTPLLLYLLPSLQLLSRAPPWPPHPPPAAAFTSFVGVTVREKVIKWRWRVIKLKSDPLLCLTSSILFPSIQFLFKHVSPNCPCYQSNCSSTVFGASQVVVSVFAQAVLMLMDDAHLSWFVVKSRCSHSTHWPVILSMPLYVTQSPRFIFKV